MTATVATFQPNPFETARAELVKALGTLPVPRAIDPRMPWPDDFETIAEHIRQASRLFDAWLSAVGHEVRQNATCKISKPLFDGAYLEAVDGWATAEAQKAAEVLRTDLEEMGVAS